jgi:hypothetical protein
MFYVFVVSCLIYPGVQGTTNVHVSLHKVYIKMNILYITQA